MAAGARPAAQIALAAFTPVVTFPPVVTLSAVVALPTLSTLSTLPTVGARATRRTAELAVRCAAALAGRTIPEGALAAVTDRALAGRALARSAFRAGGWGEAERPRFRARDALGFEQAQRGGGDLDAVVALEERLERQELARGSTLAEDRRQLIAQHDVA